jgi:tetratricopeptide (TPR) repeat protein
MAAVAVGALIATAAAMTVTRNAVWANPETLWRDAVAKSPGKARPHMALGAELGRQGRWTEATRELEAALALRPAYEEAWTNLGNVRLATGDLRGAIVAYRSALEADREHLSAWRNLAVALERAGDLQGAGESYEQALRRAASDAAALNGLAAVRLRQGRWNEARELARRAAELGQAAPRLMQQIERAAAAGLAGSGSPLPGGAP